MTGLATAFGQGATAAPAGSSAGGRPPILVGIDGEFSLRNSQSAQAIERGVRIAADAINQRGGLLGGRPIDVVTRDHGSIAARGIRNLKEFAAMPQLVAVFSGRFSPVVLEQLPVIEETGTLLLAPWSSADGIVDNGMQPNYVFRLSLRDGLAMPKLLDTAVERGFTRVGLLLTNTGWGRSNKAAADRYMVMHRAPHIVRTAWYNFRDSSLLDPYRSLLAAGAQAIVLVANDDEAAILVREMASLPPNKRLPILSHWGVSGGDFVVQASAALFEVDFSLIQTFSFMRARPHAWRRFMRDAANRYAIHRPEDIVAPVGVAHAYDLMHILARAIQLAETAERNHVREALEQVRDHDGLIKRYARPFAPGRHEALDAGQLLMARYRADGVLVPIDP